MPRRELPDPFSNNLLCKHLGPILTREDVLTTLFGLPNLPERLTDYPQHIRIRWLGRVVRLHFPREVEGRLHETVDLMLRDGYDYRDPTLPSTFATLGGESLRFAAPSPNPLGAAVAGISGGGKSTSISMVLRMFPQSIVHKSFPQMEGPHTQVVWMSVEAPPSGSMSDFAEVLMRGLDKITGAGRFSTRLERVKIVRPLSALMEWQTVAQSHFLGLLHIDEVQNFFRPDTVERRRKRKAGDPPPELTILEDACLRWLLGLMNAGIPLLVSGTPDGIGALTKRLSTLQRFTSMGALEFHPFGLDKHEFVQFLHCLEGYQFTKKKLVIDADVREEIYALTAGVPRILIALWIAANRVALESSKDVLELRHFSEAAEVFLAPIKPAVNALLSPNPHERMRYDDLVSADPDMWVRFWSAIGVSASD